jgi:hypothetical protein
VIEREQLAFGGAFLLHGGRSPDGDGGLHHIQSEASSGSIGGTNDGRELPSQLVLALLDDALSHYLWLTGTSTESAKVQEARLAHISQHDTQARLAIPELRGEPASAETLVDSSDAPNIVMSANVLAPLMTLAHDRIEPVFNSQRSHSSTSCHRRKG